MHGAGLRVSRSATDFDAAGARVIGISPDSIASHVKFRDKHGLPFRLLSDPDHIGRRGLRRLGREVDVRTYVHGHRTQHVRHRRRTARSNTPCTRSSRRATQGPFWSSSGRRALPWPASGSPVSVLMTGAKGTGAWPGMTYRGGSRSICCGISYGRRGTAGRRTRPGYREATEQIRRSIRIDPQEFESQVAACPTIAS